VTEVTELSEPEATRDITPVPEVPEAATRDIAPPKEEKPDPDLVANSEELTSWLNEIGAPDAPEHKVWSTIGEPPEVPVQANGPASWSLADGDTTDETAGAEVVGPNGANIKDTMAWLAESPNPKNLVPVASEAEFVAVRVCVAELEKELEEAKKKASEREEEFLAKEKAHEEQLQKLNAEAVEMREEFQAKEKAHEEQLQKLNAEAVEMREELQAERSRSAAAAEAAAKATAAATATESLSEVIEFVRGLATDNAALRRQQQRQPQPPQQQVVAASAKEAIAAGVAESDGYQIAPLLVLLQEKHSDLEISMKVCSALETLTFNMSENRVTVVKNGGLKALVDLLDEHKDASGPLLRPAVDALWNLTFEEIAVDAATEAGAIEHVAALMQTHRGEASLIAGACAILLNLAVREENRWKIVESGSVGLMASAMQQHPENEELMELGSQALYMLAYHQDLKPVVLAARGSEAAALAAACPPGAGKAQMWGRWLQEVLAC